MRSVCASLLAKQSSIFLSACNTGGDGEVVNVRVIDGG